MLISAGAGGGDGGVWIDADADADYAAAGEQDDDDYGFHGDVDCLGSDDDGVHVAVLVGGAVDHQSSFFHAIGTLTDVVAVAIDDDVAAAAAVAASSVEP